MTSIHLISNSGRLTRMAPLGFNFPEGKLAYPNSSSYTALVSGSKKEAEREDVVSNDFEKGVN